MSSNFKTESIQCTVVGCSCECFCPGKVRLRVCETCEHGWVVHAMDKMAYRTPAHQMSGQSVEVVQPNIVFDIASLMLYGAQATPIRLKILLDRLFSVVQHDEVLQVLHSFGWSYEDYTRGYILHDTSGRVLDKWSMATLDEEQIILQQFLRFGETKAIAQELISRDGWEQVRTGSHCLLTSRAESDIKKFIERSNVGMHSFIKGYDAAQQLLSRTLMYPHLATAGFARLLTPTLLHSLAPAAVGAIPAAAAMATTLRDKPGLSSPVAPGIINPMSRSPLRSLQTMEPFDYRKDSVATNSPKGGVAPVSVVDALGQSPLKMIDGRALLNLAVGGPAAASALSAAAAAAAAGNPHLMMVKSEAMEDKSSSSSSKTAFQMEMQRQQHQQQQQLMRDAAVGSTDGAINYSIKDKCSSSASGSMMTFPCASISSSASSSQQQSSIVVVAAAAAAAAAAVGNISNSSSSSIFIHQKLKHLRKSSNPMKRPWQPTPGYGGTLISPSGKKRVLCTACHKTFCDKGALKIHYSAVHLKEMHRCTVDGCTMMFSSRRSRNRHSANPNPKLHMPQTVRRKLPDNVVNSNHVDDDGDDDDDKPYSPCPGSVSHDEVDGVLMGTPYPPRPAGPPQSRSQPVVLDVMSDSSDGELTVQETLSRQRAAAVAAAGFPLVCTAPRFFLNPGLPSTVSMPSQILVEGLPLQMISKPPPLTLLNRPEEDGPGPALEMNPDEQTITKEMMQGDGMLPQDTGSAQGGSSRSSSKRKSAVPTRCSLQTDDVVSDNSVDNDVDDDEAPDRKKLRENNSVDGSGEWKDEGSAAPSPLILKRRDSEASGAGLNLKKESVELGHPAPPDDESNSDKKRKIDHLHSQIGENDVDDDGRVLLLLPGGPRTSTPSSGTTAAIASPIDVALLQRSVPDSLQHSPQSGGCSVGSEDTSMTSVDQEEQQHAKERGASSCPSDSILLFGGGGGGRGEGLSIRSSRDSSEVNDSGVADLKSVDDGELDRKCQTCNKSFQTHFTVRSLSLQTGDGCPTGGGRMNHVCMVDGCNAAFPSKRSRDRHSANMNLHRRLLSTHLPVAQGAGAVGQETCGLSSSGSAGGMMSVGAVDKRGEGSCGSDTEPSFYTALNLSKTAASSVEVGGSRGSQDPDDVVSSSGGGLALIGMGGAGGLGGCAGGKSRPQSVDMDDSRSGIDSPPPMPSTDGSGGTVTCHICQDAFKDNLALKEHQERSHPKETYRCTVSGCDKIFSTRKSRNRHSQNENLHKHLLVHVVASSAGSSSSLASSVTRQLAL